MHSQIAGNFVYICLNIVTKRKYYRTKNNIIVKRKSILKNLKLSFEMGIYQLIIINIFFLTTVVHLCVKVIVEGITEIQEPPPRCTSEACRLL